MKHDTESIWRAFSCQLKGFILKRVADEALADDLLQEVFIKIHTHIGTLHDETRIESWIYQITRNTLIDYYRSRRRKLGLDVPQIASDLDVMPENTPHEEIASGLKTMIDELPEQYRQALVLTEFEGLSQKRLAQHLGLSVSGAKSRVQRARQQLQDLLMQCCHFEFDHYGTIIGYHPITCCCCAASCPPNPS
ncbi:RNA polymerase sigma factor SigZ [candidate division KSB3 bacterium]|uniref:RNA polymerase sigma factor SigZ n=1 Tax=candidate division KSB3 bacterium TaxID=2044937 RepID=A0A9D5JZP9_9BACT|nr:RNA polymerase sigma factor SigZ [candidate division KSB3 bacterium]MBD3326767.1 RNA polymerase sigma factor SigZ [candidate division KSB3 bacterium]